MRGGPPLRVARRRGLRRLSRISGPTGLDVGQRGTLVRVLAEERHLTIRCNARDRDDYVGVAPDCSPTLGGVSGTLTSCGGMRGQFR